MEYLCKPKHIAVVITLQSHLHKVNGRNNSGDLTIGPFFVDSGRFENESGSCSQQNEWEQHHVYKRQTGSEIPTYPHICINYDV